VRRFLIGVVVLALAGALAACGGRGSAGGPAVAVAWQPGSGFDGLYVAALTPVKRPTGVAALKVVRNGAVETVGSYRFALLQGPGSVQVRSTQRSITATWRLPGHDPEVMRLSIPRRMRGSDAAWSGGTVDPQGGWREETVWEQERALGHPPNGPSNMVIGDFDALVRESVQYAKRTAYCLTLRVDER
jgi:hypothetical protein